MDAENTGLSYHVVRPDQRQGFGHRHENAEEIYVVLSGAGRAKLDDEIVEVETMDAIRVPPQVTRAFEAGPEGLELLAFGPRHEGDGELVHDFWPTG
jgi:mannose-6-phosphate isomerase-like protein (cupin superfamily)